MFGIDDAIAAVSGLGDTIVKRVWPDATEVEKAKIAQVASEMQSNFNLLLGQIETNKLEAGSTSLFVAGWRPFVGWICAVCLLYANLLEPLGRFVTTVFFGYIGSFPIINSDLTLQVLLGLLGLAGMRSYEKIKLK